MIIGVTEIVFICIAYLIIGHFLYGYALWISIEEVFVSPQLLHEDTKMNWFGCWFVWLLGIIFAPFCSIGGGRVWLCTVGRKD